MKLTNKSFALFFLTLTGCAQGPALYPASGELTTTLGRIGIPGNALVELNEVVPCSRVDFIPCNQDDSEKLAATGLTDFHGRFTMETAPHGPGVVAGSYKVVVKINEQIHKRDVPKEYLALDTTPLIVDIPEGGTTNLKLSLVREIIDPNAGSMGDALKGMARMKK